MLPPALSAVVTAFSRAVSALSAVVTAFSRAAALSSVATAFSRVVAALSAVAPARSHVASALARVRPGAFRAGSPRARRLALDAVTVLLAVAGLTLVVVGGGAPAPIRSGAADAAVPQGPPGPTDPAARPGGSDATGGSTPADTAATGGGAPASTSGTAPGAHAAPLGRSEPVRLDIPAIGVSTALIRLGLNADGTIEVPPLGHSAPAGWYRHLATPGGVGPAVFFRLTELRPGDQVAVRRADGRTAVFTVTRVEEYPKSAFPTGAVYGALDHPELRLVTCGGTFDKFRRQYHGNVVAYATYTASTP